MSDITINLSKDWNTKAVEALLHRLYVTRRRCNAIGIDHPAFVIPCRNEEARANLEKAIYAYYITKFGGKLLPCDQSIVEGDSIFHFDFGVTLVLMNV